MQWCKNIIAYFVKEQSDNIIFIPYAAVGFSYQSYTDKVNEALQEEGITVRNINDFANKSEMIDNATAIFVGGGNTFHLLKMLQDEKLIKPIVQAVKKGTLYIGWSAGSNIASPTICTTNDMPIVEPKNFNSLSLVPFQINPHYTELTIENHGGESRKQRLKEYLFANQKSQVICLPEASYIKVKNTDIQYLGTQQGKVLSFESEDILESGQSL